MLLRSLLKKNLKKLKLRNNSMEVLIPLAVVAVVIAWSIERWKPEWIEQAKSKIKSLIKK